MEYQIFMLLMAAFISAIIAILGINRKIGYGWSFVTSLFLTPIIGIIIILMSEKKNKEITFIDLNK